MNEDEFKRAYAELEEGVVAGDELKARTKALLRGEGRPAAKRGPSRADGATTAAPRWRVAVAACLAVVVGVGLLAGTGSLERTGMLLSGNSFALVAFAEESPTDGDGRASVGFDLFYPARTSAGYLYDAASDSIDRNVVAVSRYYVFDMTVTGRNIQSVSYAIEGDGVSYGSWKSGQGEEGVVAEEQSTSFEVPFEEEEPVVREIGLSYVLDEDEKSAFDQLYAARDAEGTAALLATCDARRLSDTTITATARFADGSTQTKTYGFEPVEGFGIGYQELLAQLADSEDPGRWAALADELALFDLVEK